MQTQIYKCKECASPCLIIIEMGGDATHDRIKNTATCVCGIGHEAKFVRQASLFGE
jgi:hypothetical protein